MRLLWKTTLSRSRYKNIEAFSRHTRGMDMGLVRRINESGKGCGAILNKSAVKDLLYCGMKSGLPFQGQDKYHLCEDCFLMFKLSQEIQTK